MDQPDIRTLRVAGQEVRVALHGRPEAGRTLLVFNGIGAALETVTRFAGRSMASTSPWKKCTRRSSLRIGLAMWARSRSLAATSWSIGVNRKKLSRLTNVISTSASRARVFSSSSAA